MDWNILLVAVSVLGLAISSCMLGDASVDWKLRTFEPRSWWIIAVFLLSIAILVPTLPQVILPEKQVLAWTVITLASILLAAAFHWAGHYTEPEGT